MLNYIQCFNFRPHELESETAEPLFKLKKAEQTLKKNFFFETAVPSGGGIWELNKSSSTSNNDCPKELKPHWKCAQGWGGFIPIPFFVSNQLSLNTNLEFQFRGVQMGAKHSGGSDEKLMFRSETVIRDLAG